MPSAAVLKNYAGTPENIANPKTAYTTSIAKGAFWLNPNVPIQHIEEIQEDAHHLRTYKFNFSDNPAEIEREVLHIGNMITRYSDSQIVNFDQRLREAQQASLDYEKSYNSANGPSLALYNKAVALNLALSHEVRSNLRNTLSQVVDFGTPLDVAMTGTPDEIENIRAASLYYPSDWNTSLQSTLNATFKGYDEGSSSWRPLNNEILLTNKSQNYMSYASMDEVEKAKRENMRKYETGTATVHEYAHKMESINPGIFEVCNIIRSRRIAALPLVRKGRFEYGQDHFATPYIGKIYNSSVHTEIFSMGMESTFLGTYGGLIGLSLPPVEGHETIKHNRADIEHRNLTVGLLATFSMQSNHDNRSSPIDSAFELEYTTCRNGCRIYCKCRYCNNHEATCPRKTGKR